MVVYLFNTLLFLNIIGSSIYLLSKALFVIAGEHVNERARYLGSITVLLLFLIPAYQILPMFFVAHAGTGGTEYGVLPLASAGSGAQQPLNRAVADWLVPGYEIQKNLLAVWLAGMILVMLWNLVAFLRFRRKLLQRAGRTVSEELQKVADICAAECKIHQRPILRALPDVHGPMLIGFFRPIIAIPANGLSQQEAPLIFKHELVHFKRHDLWWKLLGVIMQAIHWFNPLVYMLCKELEFYTETSCDAEVVRNLGHSQRKQYGALLISYVQIQRKPNSLPSLSFPPEHKQLKRRIFVMIHGNKSKKVIATAIIGVLTASVFAVSAFAADSQSDRIRRESERAFAVSGPAITENPEYPFAEVPNSGDRWGTEYGYCRRGENRSRYDRNCRRQGYSNARGQGYCNRGARI